MIKVNQKRPVFSSSFNGQPKATVSANTDTDAFGWPLNNSCLRPHGDHSVIDSNGNIGRRRCWYSSCCMSAVVTPGVFTRIKCLHTGA